MITSGWAKRENPVSNFFFHFHPVHLFYFVDSLPPFLFFVFPSLSPSACLLFFFSLCFRFQFFPLRSSWSASEPMMEHRLSSRRHPAVFFFSPSFFPFHWRNERSFAVISFSLISISLFLSQGRTVWLFWLLCVRWETLLEESRDSNDDEVSPSSPSPDCMSGCLCRHSSSSFLSSSFFLRCLSLFLVFASGIPLSSFRHHSLSLVILPDEGWNHFLSDSSSPPLPLSLFPHQKIVKGISSIDCLFPRASSSLQAGEKEEG